MPNLTKSTFYGPGLGPKIFLIYLKIFLINFFLSFYVFFLLFFVFLGYFGDCSSNITPFLFKIICFLSFSSKSHAESFRNFIKNKFWTRSMRNWTKSRDLVMSGPVQEDPYGPHKGPYGAHMGPKPCRCKRYARPGSHLCPELCSALLWLPR